MWNGARAMISCAPLLAACGPSSVSMRPTAIDPAARASIEATLTSGVWSSGSSGSTVWIWETMRFTVPDRLEKRRGLRTHAGGLQSASPVEVGSYRITATGAVEHTIGGATWRRTFVVAPDAQDRRTWVHAGYLASGPDHLRYRHEFASRGPDRAGVEVECEIDLPAALETLEDPTCRMRVRVRTRTFAGAQETGSQSLETEGRCTVDRRRRLPRISFEGFEGTEPVQATSEWTNWLSRNGHRRSNADIALDDAFRSGFVPVLAYDPRAPQALFAAYVSGPVLEEPRTEP
jgi:hypothetical protein